MANLQKMRVAEQDLVEIWHHTAKQWGEAQADKYLCKIEKCFEKISRGSIPLRKLTEKIQFTRCEHHYIFLSIVKEPIIIAVLHEKMDLLTRLKKRLA